MRGRVNGFIYKKLNKRYYIKEKKNLIFIQFLDMKTFFKVIIFSIAGVFPFGRVAEVPLLGDAYFCYQDILEV